MAKARKAKRAGKKAKKAKKKVAKAALGSLVVASKVRAYVRAQKVNCSAEVVDALNAVVCETLKKAVARATANKRKTVRAQDL